MYVEKITTLTIQIKELLLLFLLACLILPTHLGWSVLSASCLQGYQRCTYQNILKHQKMYLTVFKTTSKIFSTSSGYKNMIFWNVSSVSLWFSGVNRGCCLEQQRWRISIHLDLLKKPRCKKHGSVIHRKSSQT